MPPPTETKHNKPADVVMHEEELLAGEEDVNDEEEEIDIVDDGSALDADTRRFNRIIGALEDVLMDPDFEEVRETFCRTHCQVFEDTDENKLVYTDIFEKYTGLVENTIDSRLQKALPGFSMQEFSQLLTTHKDQLMSEVFDLLLSLGDFEAFKEVMLSYKQELQSGGAGFGISCSAMKIHTEEQEDGDARPDLDGLGLCVQPLSPASGGGKR